MEERPPLGVIPEWLWKEQRVAALADAISRCSGVEKSHFPQCLEWARELVRHMEYLTSRKVETFPSRQEMIRSLKLIQWVNEPGPHIPTETIEEWYSDAVGKGLFS